MKGDDGKEVLGCESRRDGVAQDSRLFELERRSLCLETNEASRGSHRDYALTSGISKLTEM